MNAEQASKLRTAYDIIKALLHEHDNPQVNPNEDPFSIREPETVTKKDWTRPGLWPIVKQDPYYRELCVALMKSFRHEEDWIPWAGLFNEWGPKNVIGAVKIQREKQEPTWPNVVLIELQRAWKLKQEQRSKEAAIKALQDE